MSISNPVTLSEDLRTAAIPQSERILGAVGDANVRRVRFELPADCDGTDLGGFTPTVHYVSAAGTEDFYAAADKSVSDGTMSFTWLVGRIACEAEGDVRVSVKLREYDTSGEEPVVTREFNSGVFALRVVEALDSTSEVDPEVIDTITLVIAEATAATAAANAAASSATAAASTATGAASDATDAATTATTAAQSATTAAQAATTAAQTAATAAGNADTATAAANTAAANANAAAVIADDSAADADAATVNANSAATGANGAAQAASTATTAANAATERAIAAAEAAEEAAGGVLPTMSASTKGGARLGAGLSMSGEVLSADVTTADVTRLEGLISAIPRFEVLVVSTLPATGAEAKLYLVRNSETAGSDLYDEYIWLGSAYEHLGTARIDLSGYVTQQALQAAVALLEAAIADKADQSDLDSLSQAVAGKASAADLTALQGAVATKADSTTVTALADTVAGKASAAAVAAKQDKPTVAQATMLASGWSNGVYSFESAYPAASYDIEIAPTEASLTAFAAAKLVGVYGTSTVKATGTVPTADMACIVRAWAK